MQDTIIKTKNLVKSFEKGKLEVLKGIDLEIKKGEFAAILGPSGSGKSTILNLLGALDRPTSGEIKVAGVDLAKVKNLDNFRSQKIGFIFQLHNLIPTLTALENVLIPTFEERAPKKEKTRRAKELLELVGLKDRTRHVPTKLSGGERQRVAIARAFVNEPEIILADEPTGNVDEKMAHKIIDLLREVNKKRGTTLIIVTHDDSMAEYAQEVFYLKGGKLKEK
jgi:putative ABC transport system ATP-binding protein